jgi:hypothetical protein
MNATRWQSPVMLACKKSGQYFVITNTQEALDMLSAKWPVSEGRAFIEALEICAAVMEGRRRPEEAQSAFLNAADEAGIPVVDCMALDYSI